MEKVQVRIYGQEYTICGDRDEKTIRDIASYVNDKMVEMGKGFSSNAQGSLAVLTAVNIADELFDAWSEADALEKEKEQLNREAAQYERLWEEAKQSFVERQEDVSKAEAGRADLENYVAELEGKVKEFENAIFDLQMENIKLQSQLENR